MSDICLNCFSETGGASICPVCHFDNGMYRIKKKNDLALAPFTSVGNGRFLLGAILGAGGFGITYAAYDNKMRMRCSIKEYAPLNIAVRQVNSTELVVADESKRKIYQHGRKRFYEEAEALYKCRDIPEIVSLIGYFQENNTAYFAMEYIEGLTLRNYAKLYPNRRVAEKKAVEIVSKTCIALEQVHSKTHIFHRDISPENIMIMRDEGIKLIDFGSAKNLDGANSRFSIVLKPGFAPPEQYISTGKQGRYTDVYALAGTLYFLLSGQTLPPAPERASGVTYVKLKDMGYGITPALSDAIDRGLILKVEDRIQTAAEFGNAISDACGLPAISGSRPPMTGTAAKPYVEVVSGIMNHAKWYLPPDKNVLLGRSEEDDIVTQGSQMISNKHITVRYVTATNSFQITDMGSTNGTYRNDVHLLPHHTYEMTDGAVIELGAGVMKLKVGVQYG